MGDVRVKVNFAGIGQIMTGSELGTVVEGAAQRIANCDRKLNSTKYEVGRRRVRAAAFTIHPYTPARANWRFSGYISAGSM